MVIPMPTRRPSSHARGIASIVDDTSATRETLSRLEAGLGSLSDNFSSYRDDVQALKIQQANQQSQMQAMQADFKASMQSVATTFQSEISKIGSDIDRVIERINDKDKPRRDLWIGTATAGIAFLGMFIAASAFFVNANISSATAPMVQQLTSLAQMPVQMHELELASLRSTQADTRSEQDRLELNRRLGTLETAFATGAAERREQITELNAGRVEIETQFKNLTALVYYLWHKVTGDPFPIVPRETSR